MSFAEQPVVRQIENDGAADAPATLASLVYLQLRTDILGGVLSPGSKLRIGEVCKRYDKGSSPVREALNRLVSEELVEKHDQRGFVVASISLSDFRELVTTRCWVEEIALREAIKNRTDAWEENLLLAFHRMSRARKSIATEEAVGRPKWESLHFTFHQTLIANCQSRWLLRFCWDLREKSDRYRKIAADSMSPPWDAHDEHSPIMDAAIEGREDDAVALLKRHYWRTYEAIEKGGLTAK